MSIVFINGEAYKLVEPEPPSPLSVILTLGICLATFGLATYFSRKERAEVQKHETEMMEILTDRDETGDPRDWFPSLFPTTIHSEIIGGRMWRHYPFRIGGDLYTAFSTSPRYLYVMGQGSELLSLPWSEVKEVAIFLKRPAEIFSEKRA